MSLPLTHIPLNTQKDQIESKFQNRKETLFAEENFSQIKEDSMNNELSLGKNVREKYFVQKRLKQKLIKQSECPNKILDILTISRDFYDKCQNMTVNIKQLKESGLIERIGSDKTGYWKIK